MLEIKFFQEFISLFKEFNLKSLNHQVYIYVNSAKLEKVSLKVNYVIAILLSEEDGV